MPPIQSKQVQRKPPDFRLRPHTGRADKWILNQVQDDGEGEAERICASAIEAAGVSQPDISRLLKGHFRDISIERIMRMLTRLGCAVEVTVRPAGSAEPGASIRFAGVGE